MEFAGSNPAGGHMENGKKSLKIVVVGDGSVGKTCLLLAYSRGEIPSAYVPTVFENFSHQITYKNEEYVLHLWDTAGQEEYDRLRPLSYADSDVVLLCFAVNNRTSFENVLSKWDPEIKHYIPSAKTILVGLKVDLRDEVPDAVTEQEGQELAKKLECEKYLEASSVKRTGLAPVFETSVDCIFANQAPVSTSDPTVAALALTRSRRPRGSPRNRKRRHVSFSNYWVPGGNSSEFMGWRRKRTVNGSSPGAARTRSTSAGGFGG